MLGVRGALHRTSLSRTHLFSTLSQSATAPGRRGEGDSDFSLRQKGKLDQWENSDTSNGAGKRRPGRRPIRSTAPPRVTFAAPRSRGCISTRANPWQSNAGKTRWGASLCTPTVFSRFAWAKVGARLPADCPGGTMNISATFSVVERTVRSETQLQGQRRRHG